MQGSLPLARLAISGYCSDIAVIKTEHISKGFLYFPILELMPRTVSVSLCNGCKYSITPSAIFVARLIIPLFTAPKNIGILFLVDTFMILKL